LTEAIALGHDLGHTPFGHTGEDALSDSIERYVFKQESTSANNPNNHNHLNHNHLNPNHPTIDGFRHNEQSIRVVEIIEKDGQGLNLTKEVRDGILHHTGFTKASTLEGQIVAIADRIAYVNHDTDDAIRAGIITSADLPKSTHLVLGDNNSARIAKMVGAMISTSDGKDEIKMEASTWEAMMELRAFLFEEVYKSDVVIREVPKAIRLVGALFDHYLSQIDDVPIEYRRISGDNDLVAVKDYIAGMTDRYAVQAYESAFVPYGWKE
jgi:dGTPase